MALNLKHNETRSRALAYRGDIAICATREKWIKDVPEYAMPALKILWEHRSLVPGYHGNIRDLYLALPFGKCVCVVEKIGCVSTNDDNGDDRSLTPTELELGDYSVNRFYYPTTNLRVLRTPVSVIGKQGLFELPPDIEAAIRTQIG